MAKRKSPKAPARYWIDIGLVDGPLLRKQREMLDRIRPVNSGEEKLFAGLRELLDRVTDELWDRYGIDALLERGLKRRPPSDTPDEIVERLQAAIASLLKTSEEQQYVDTGDALELLRYIADWLQHLRGAAGAPT